MDNFNDFKNNELYSNEGNPRNEYQQEVYEDNLREDLEELRQDKETQQALDDNGKEAESTGN